MASSTPFGVIPQSEGLVEGIQSTVREEDDAKRSSQTEKRIADSISTGASFSEKKDGYPKKDIGDNLDTSTGRARVEELARTFTEMSTKSESGLHINPFSDSSDPALDPKSGKFNPTKWVKTLIGIASRDPERYPKRVAGISYRNLNVHGFGNPTDYQKTVRLTCDWVVLE